MMYGAVYHGPGDVRVEQVPKPVAKDDNVIVKVDCCLICGTDLKMWMNGNVKINPPKIMGHEMSGRVVHVGNFETDLKVGQRVVVLPTCPCGVCEYCKAGLSNMCPNATQLSLKRNGAFAEYLEMTAEVAANLFPVPEGVEAEAAAICEPLACAINSHEKISVKTGDTVVVIGGGPLGAVHAELAKAKGASKVMLVGRTKERLKLLENLKDVDLIDGSSTDVEAYVKAQTGGFGADKVIVCAPVASAFYDAMSYVRKGGAISYFASLPQGGAELNLDSRQIHYNELIIAGASDSRPEHIRKALEYLAAGKIDTSAIITHRVELKDFLKGLEWMKNRECLKVAVYPGK